MSEEKTGGLSKKTSVILAVTFSVLAFVVFKTQVRQAEVALTQEYGKKAKVVVATKDLTAGSEIEGGMVEAREIPAAFIQPGAVADPENAVGRVAQIPIKKGEQVLETKLVQSEGGYLSFRIGKAESRRAITLKLDGEGGLAGLARPGDYVDVIGVFESAGEGGPEGKINNHAMVVAQAVRVLAVDARLSDTAIPAAGEGSGRSSDNSGNPKGQWLVSLDVSAAEAWKLSLASQIGHLRCVLRYRTNKAPVAYGAITPGELKEGMKEIKGGEVFGASGKTIWPSGQRSGQMGYPLEQ